MRTWIGGTLAALGALAWAWTMTMLEPATWRAYEAQQAAVRDGTIAVAVDVEYMDQMVLMAKDLRWAALVLAVGGLLVLLVSRARWALLGGVVWLAADIVLDRLDFAGWIPLVTLLVVLSAVVVLAGRHSRAEAEVPSSAAVLCYSGVAAALAPLMFFTSPEVSPYRPAEMLFVGSVISVGLAVSAMAVALTAVREPTPRLVLRAMAIAVLVISPAIAAQLWSATAPQAADQQTLVTLLPWASAPILLLTCLLLVKGRPQGSRWLGFSALALGVTVASYVLLYLGIGVSYYLQYQILPLTGDKAFFDGYQFSVAAFGAGLLLGCIALIARVGALQKTKTREA